MIDEHGEGQVETYHADRLGAVIDGRNVWTKGPRWSED
jgi:hypothetical protein